MSLVFGNTPAPPIILASGSPRRQFLLGELLTFDKIPFTVEVPDIDEAELITQFTANKPLTPANLACKLARAKAEAVLTRVAPHAMNSPLSNIPDADGNEPSEDSYPLVIGADTIVVHNDEILGKPEDTTEAVAMLNRLQGQSHQVLTGLAVLHKGRLLVDVGITTVWVEPIEPEDIEAYVASGEPMDKAGAYAIQGAASLWIPRIQGCYFNVVGLPLALVGRLMRQAVA